MRVFSRLCNRFGSTKAAQQDLGRRYSLVRDGARLSTFAADLEHHRRREKREKQPGSASMPSEGYRGLVRPCRDLHGLGRPHSSAWASDGGRGAQVSAGSVLRQTVSREYHFFLFLLLFLDYFLVDVSWLSAVDCRTQNVQYYMTRNSRKSFISIIQETLLYIREQMVKLDVQLLRILFPFQTLLIQIVKLDHAYLFVQNSNDDGVFLQLNYQFQTRVEKLIIFGVSFQFNLGGRGFVLKLIN